MGHVWRLFVFAILMPVPSRAQPATYTVRLDCFASIRKPVTPEDLERGASEVAGADLSSFFSAHVATEDYAGEAFVVRSPAPSVAARGVLQHLLSGS